MTHIFFFFLHSIILGLPQPLPLGCFSFLFFWIQVNTITYALQAKLDEAVALATGFQTSLQDTINWLTQAEQTLNMAQPPSLLLDTVLFQIDEHKVLNLLNLCL